MKRNFFYVIIISTLTAVLISACTAATPTQDPNIQITSIASTVQAQLTQIALLTPSATPTLEPTATSTPVPATDTPSGPTQTYTTTPPPALGTSGPTEDNSKFTLDVTVPDGTQFTPGTTFVKTWRFTNTGKTTWTKDYKLVYIDGITGKNNTLEVNLPGNVIPGATVDISVTFVAPSTNGSYTSWWRLYTANGTLFGDPCNVVFTVGTTAATPAITATTLPATTSTP